MTVTENDITTNAAAIAALVNGATSLTIADLSAVTSLSGSDILHCSVSSVDKKITKTNALKTTGATENNIATFDASALVQDSGISLATIYGKFPYIQWLPAGKLYYPTGTLAPAPLNTDVGSNVEDLPANLMDGSTDEGLEYIIYVPSAATGTVQIYGWGYSAAASPSGTVVLSAQFSPWAADGTDTWDQAYGTPILSSAVTMDTQKRIEIFSLSETYATLLNNANGLAKMQIFRDVSEDTMATDFSFMGAVILIPRA